MILISMVEERLDEGRWVHDRGRLGTLKIIRSASSPSYDERRDVSPLVRARE